MKRYVSFQVGVRSLGWVELNEDTLTSENSSKAVNRCIVQLSANADGPPEDPSKLWGEGNDLVMELDEGTLKLIDPETQTVINSQPIHTIRVWGVGRDNGKDFAYVARDKLTRKHMCHVFRCDLPARAIANTLRDICKKILIERSLAQSSSKLIGGSEKKPQPKPSRPLNRPTSLIVNDKLKTRTVPAPESFPTPMEEPRKVLKAMFLGQIQVTKPCGMDIINESIDNLVNEVPRADWKMVSVSVAPSTVTVNFTDGLTAPIDCRVRFLSFLGIGRDDQFCAFIMHTAQDTFVAHVFQCEGCCSPLCKTIEAACKLRYQKCLDARPNHQRLQSQPPGSLSVGDSERKSIGATLKSMFGSLASRRSTSQSNEG